MFCNWCGKKQTMQQKKGKQRGNGSGTVYQLPNKKWRAEVRVMANGANIRRTKDGFLRKKTLWTICPFWKTGNTLSRKSRLFCATFITFGKKQKNIKECQKTKNLIISRHGAASRSYSTGIFKRLHSSKCKKLLTAHRVHITQSVILKRFYPICTKLQKEKKYFLQTKLSSIYRIASNAQIQTRRIYIRGGSKDMERLRKRK